MGKAPAFQFYVKDWLGDPELQCASSSSRGLWINALCYMWESRERGKISGTAEELSRLLRATNGDFSHFLEDAERFKFCDVERHETSRGDTMLTIINRRMERDTKSKESHTLRQSKYREKLKRDAKVTPPSSSSSSSSSSILIKKGETPPFNLPEKEEIEEASDPMILEQINKLCDQLYKEKIFPEVNSFKNKMVKIQKNPRSILHTLCRAYIKREFDEGPWAYCLKVIEIESGKYSARDYRKAAPKST